MTEQTLRQRLDATHAEYDENASRWALNLELWNGSGGVSPPCDDLLLDDSQYGNRPNPLPTWKGHTALDRYPRESWHHFKCRIRSAYYENYLADIGDTILGFLSRRPPEWPKLTPDLKAWWGKADLAGRPVLEILWAALGIAFPAGWCPILVDRPVQTAPNKAAAERLGLRTYAMPLEPQKLINWRLDTNGALAWAVIRDVYSRQDGPLDPAVAVTRWTVWTAKDWTRYEAEDGQDPVASEPVPHPCRRVPIVALQMSPPAPGCMTSRSPLWTTAELCRAIYNRTSEKTDIMRGFGAPLLLWPTKAASSIRAIKAGTDAAVPCSDVGNMPAFLTIPASVAADYTSEIDRLVSSAYRQARADFASQAAQSGYSRAQMFQAKNAQLVQVMGRVVGASRELARLNALWDGASDDQADAAAASAEAVVADDYDLRDLAREMEAAEAAARIGLGPTAMAKIKKQVRDGLVTLKGKELDASNAELEAEAQAMRGAPESIPPAGQTSVDVHLEEGKPDDDSQGEEPPVPPTPATE